jgi:hypothetical protein
MIHSNLVDEMNHSLAQHPSYFMQDGASAHTAKTTSDHLQSICLVSSWIGTEQGNSNEMGADESAVQRLASADKRRT